MPIRYSASAAVSAVAIAVSCAPSRGMWSECACETKQSDRAIRLSKKRSVPARQRSLSHLNIRSDCRGGENGLGWSNERYLIHVVSRRCDLDKKIPQKVKYIQSGHPGWSKMGRFEMRSVGNQKSPIGVGV